MKEYILKKQNQIDKWLDGNWYAFIIMVGWFAYEWSMNFDKWIGV